MSELDEWRQRLDSMHMRDRVPRQKYEGEVYHWRPIRAMKEDEPNMTIKTNEEPLKAVSNVIELKPGHKYLLVLKGDHIDQFAGERANVLLREMGIESIYAVIGSNDDLQVIEVPDEKGVSEPAKYPWLANLPLTKSYKPIVLTEDMGLRLVEKDQTSEGSK